MQKGQLNCPFFHSGLSFFHPDLPNFAPSNSTDVQGYFSAVFFARTECLNQQGE